MKALKVGVLVLLIFSFVAAGVFAGGGQERTVERQELVVYSTIFAGYAERMKEEFEARNPGVTVQVINPGGTEAMVSRLRAESNNPRADVVHSGGSSTYQVMKNDGLLQAANLGNIGIPAEIPLGAGMLPTRDPENHFFSWAILFSGFMINTDQMRQLGLPVPTSYADLANPVYNGHVISPNPLLSSTAVTNVMAVVQAYGEERAWQLWEEIDANIGFYSDSTSNTYNLVARGEYPIAIVVNRPVYELQLQGYPVEFVIPRDGTMVQDNAMGVVKGARNKELAERFITFILSEDMQRIGAEFPYTPVRPGVLEPDSFISLDNLASDINVLLLPDPDLEAAVRPTRQERFETMLRRRQ
jgi:iron(III) transport system substrate-binding protein